MKKIIYKILVGLGIAILIFALLNIEYFKAQLNYFNKKENVRGANNGKTDPNSKLPSNTIAINSLNILAPIVYITETTEAAYQRALLSGVVHFPNTANPGQLGNCYIFGHSSDYIWSKGKYKTVFAVLPQIKNGAEITITDQQGIQYTYIVTNSFVAGSKDTYLLDQQDYKKKLLTIQTSYPIGTALKRYIVQAEMK